MNHSLAFSHTTGLEIAITGMAGRFPGAKNVDEFWRNLKEGLESISFFTDQELAAAGVPPAFLSDAHYVRAGAILQDAELFDASFFGFSSREAEIMDPQQRIFLECAYEALENAGYDTETFKGVCGVYAGVSVNSYLLNNVNSNDDLIQSVGGFQVFIGNDKDFLATRVSYKLNLEGPSVVVQTACSTSLVAVHLACQGLQSGECTMALAGGVSIRIPQKAGYFYQEGGIHSPDGHCRAFDAKAQGALHGDGVGIVVLRRLADAIADGDYIHAVIKGSAINNDGSSKVGYTAPRVEGQARVIRAAQAVAEVNPETITYVETHGTGTALGDPIEIQALTKAFRAGTGKKKFCAIGSVKTNIGHLDAAAGIAGLIKTILALKHGQIPPSLHFEEPNPQIDFANSPFYVNTRLAEWRADGLRAGVSSFGIGGTNAHVIVEQAPPQEQSGPSRPWQLLFLSAKTSSSLETATRNLLDYLRQHPDQTLADVAYTLQIGRRAFNHRRVLLCCDQQDAVQALESDDTRRLWTSSPQIVNPPLALMFSGQGSQYVNMTLGLYQTEPVFREQVDLGCNLLMPRLGLDLRQILYPGADQAEAAGQQLNETSITQPALFVVEYALAQLLLSWGLRPQAMIGHSLGEYVAACLAGVFSLADALSLVEARARLMQALPEGRMLSIPLSESAVRSWMGSGLSLAAVNGPFSCVVAGPRQAVTDLEQHLSEQGVACRRLQVLRAFHSRTMEPIIGPFTELCKTIHFKPPQLPYLSNLTGAWITAEEATDPDYWARHLCQTVRFGEGLEALLQEPALLLLEVGPGRTLSTLARQHPANATRQRVFSSVRHPRDRQHDSAFLLSTLGRLWLAGLPVDWTGFYARERRHRLPLPTYPFERQRYWIEPRKGAAASPVSSKNPNIADWFYIPSWKRTMLPVQEHPATTARWLVFSRGDSLATKLAQQLQMRRDPVITVLAGEQFAVQGSDVYVLHPARYTDYETLWATLVERDQAPTRIVHLWNMSSLDENEPHFTEEAMQYSFYSLLFLAQGMSKQNLAHPLDLIVISSNMCQVNSDEIIHPEKAALLGPCKVIPQEMPHVTCRSIDIARPEAGSYLENLVIEQLLAELEAETSDSVIAYRGDDRWIQTFEPMQLAEVGGKTERKLRKQGVYVITGGLGGIGLTLAGYLARTVEPRLVLTSRTHFPDRHAWEQWLATHSPQDRTSSRIRAVQALESLGAEVWVAQADVTEQTQMEAVVRATHERFGAIHGVIHAAGVPGGGMMLMKTREAAASVLAAKVQGTRVLEKVLKDCSPDFWVLCSSITALTGGLGQVDYCAANAFMDAFAHSRKKQRDTMTVAINWDTWAEVGMAANTPLNYVTPQPQQAFEMTAVGHPLLPSFYREADQRTVYPILWNPAEQWALFEHSFMGIPTVPGTTYLELARAAFTNQSQTPWLEIREVIFPEPLMVSKGDCKEGQLILTERSQGFDFQVMSKAGVSARGEAQWQTHAMGQLSHMSKTAPFQYDIEAIRAQCNVSEIVMTPESLEHGKGKFFEFGPRWLTTLKRVYIGHAQALAWLELAPEFVSDLESFKLHPALLDVATGVGSAMSTAHRYLPLSYECMRIYESMPGRFYSYVRLKPGSAIGEKTMTFQVTLMDEQGRGIIEIEAFTVTRLDPAAITRLSKTKGESPGAAASQLIADTSYQRALDQAILPKEGIEVFQRILCRNRSPQIAVCTRLLPTLIQQVDEFTLARLEGETPPVEAPSTQHVRPHLPNAYVAPRNDIEEKLASLWRQLLGIAEVGVQDNFFELGGHSLLAVQLISRVRETFAVELPLSRFFEADTIEELALAIVAEQLGEGVDKQRLAALLSEEENLSGDGQKRLLPGEGKET